MVDKNSQSVTNVFMLLAVLAMAALAWSVSQRGGGDTQELFVPGLAGNINAVDTVQVRAGGEDPRTPTRSVRRARGRRSSR